MADVRDRAQMLMIGAFGLAAMLIVLALILNTAIYTENIATRSSDIAGGDDAGRYKQASTEASLDRLDFTNHHNNTTSQSDLETAFNDSTENWSIMAATHGSYSGVATNTSVDHIDDGTRIVQDDVRNFTNESGSSNDWMVVSGVSNIRSYQIDVDSVDSASVSDVEDPSISVNIFEIEIDDGSSIWNIYIFENSGDMKVTVIKDSTLQGTCSSSSFGVVDITNASITNTYCQHLDFFDSVSGSFDIEYKKAHVAVVGDTITGTYNFTVDKAYSAVDATDFASASPGSLTSDTPSPYKTHAVYAARVKVTYEGTRVFYEHTYRIAPGEPE